MEDVLVEEQWQRYESDRVMCHVYQKCKAQGCNFQVRCLKDKHEVEREFQFINNRLPPEHMPNIRKKAETLVQAGHSVHQTRKKRWCLSTMTWRKLSSATLVQHPDRLSMWRTHTPPSFSYTHHTLSYLLTYNMVVSMSSRYMKHNSTH